MLSRQETSMNSQKHEMGGHPTRNASPALLRRTCTTGGNTRFRVRISIENAVAALWLPAYSPVLDLRMESLRLPCLLGVVRLTANRAPPPVVPLLTEVHRIRALYHQPLHSCGLVGPRLFPEGPLHRTPGSGYLRHRMPLSRQPPAVAIQYGLQCGLCSTVTPGLGSTINIMVCQQ